MFFTKKTEPQPAKAKGNMMKRTFYAKEPGRYVQIQRNFTAHPDVPHELENEVTGYKMEIDIDTMIYDSFICQVGSPVWIPHSEGKHLTSKEDFWREVGEGHLVERDA